MTDDLDSVVRELRDLLGCAEPYNDPMVGKFGLENRVLALGGGFVEVLSPRTSDSAGARFLARHGGPGGYMAAFQVGDRAESRALTEAEGLTVVWPLDLPGMSSMHLHGKHTPGALVSLDAASPWHLRRWAGRDWDVSRYLGAAGGIRALTVGTVSPAAAAAKWGRVLGQGHVAGSRVVLPVRGQWIDFVRTEGPDEILRCTVDVPGADGLRMKLIADVEFMVPPWRHRA